ncbi:cilia- and flagella-associated protein 97 isoform X2 [Echeneis naucrates]|uniref:cilia- and flagella-associated protein 97 isoform X2 n=1 Tax=Echeneis naucrates TaxID=173247 RepID=UPI001113B3E4|nr:cilia- and flagella-associated protein 97 isoform X2 [Echeneis naucrates]
MFNPSELEGEVDHSFFDSNCEDGGIRRERGKNLGSPPTHKGFHIKQTGKTTGYLSQGTDETKRHLKQVKTNTSKVEKKENSYQSKEDKRNRASNLSSVRSISDTVVNDSSEDDHDLYSKRLSGPFMALLAKGGDKDVYSQSPNETEEETLLSSAKHLRLKRRSKQTRNRCTRSPLTTSVKAHVDADSESTSSSSTGRNSAGSSTLPKKKTSLTHGERRARVGSTGYQAFRSSHAEESDDTVTDVSPLSSPDISPLQSLDLNHTEVEEGSQKEQEQSKKHNQKKEQNKVQQQQQQDSVPSSGLSDTHPDEDVDDYSLSSESQLEGNLVFHCPGGRNRKNYSFTNAEVRRIDRENQRLLRELSRLSPGSRPGSAAGKKTSMASNSPLSHFSHSALNRQREQQRIEQENLCVRPCTSSSTVRLMPEGRTGLPSRALQICSCFVAPLSAHTEIPCGEDLFCSAINIFTSHLGRMS